MMQVLVTEMPILRSKCLFYDGYLEMCILSQCDGIVGTPCILGIRRGSGSEFPSCDKLRECR